MAERGKNVDAALTNGNYCFKNFCFILNLLLSNLINE